MHDPASTPWTIRAAAVAAALCACVAAAGGQTARVHYLVTHNDGTIHHAERVPDTAKDIRRVVRVTRYDTAAVGAVIVSTGAVPRRDIHPPRTGTHVLHWNGAAWVAPGPKVPPPPPAPPPTGTRPKAAARGDPLAEEASRIRAVLAPLVKRLAELDARVGRSQRALDEAKGTDREAAATKELAAAREAQKACAEAVAKYRRLLGSLEDAGDRTPSEAGSKAPSDSHGNASAKATAALPGKATGTVARVTRAPKQIAGGNVALVRQARVPSHRAEVWALPAARGERTYEFLMAHAEAGTFGAFYYIAYADTDGDGKPDRQIARSPLAQAARPAQWTRWKLRTSQPRVFIGRAWQNPQTQVYASQERPVPQLGPNWRSVGPEVWVAPYLGAPLGRHRRGWGFTTNLRYRVDLGQGRGRRRDDPADLRPSPPTGSGIYEWNLR